MYRASAIFAIVLVTASTALRGRDMEANTAQLSHKKDCPPGNEHYCLNGGNCFIVSPGGQYDIKGCACAIGFTGTRCQFKSVDLDILFETGPEQADTAQLGDHQMECPPGNEYYCLNGGTCFTINAGPGGLLAKGCICLREFTGRRCQYQQIPLDILFGPDSTK